MIHVIATIRLAPGTRGPFLDEFRKLYPFVRAEAGCIEYQAAVDEPTDSPAQVLAGEDTVIVVEKWATVDALAAHSKAPHMADYRPRVKDFIRTVELQILRPV